MSKTITPQKLPQPLHMSREDFLDLFVKVCNLVEPEHKYDIDYPITASDVEFSYCTRYWAKCGPRRGGRAYYAIDQGYMTSQTIERVLAVTTHEIAHLKHGVTLNQPTHPSEFWEAMAFYATEIVDHLETVNEWFDKSLSKEKYQRQVINDPNSGTVDGRIETVKERRVKMAELLGCSTEMVL